MTTPRPYPNAPITEAILDVRVRRGPARLADIEAAFGDQSDRYPTRNRIIVADAHIDLTTENTSASATHEQRGIKLTSVDGKYIAQVSLDGLSLSRLVPYQHWEPFRDEAQLLWQTYRQAVRPEAIERLAVRTINRIDIPADQKVELSDYFLTRPEFADDAWIVTGFLMQLQMPQPGIGATCVLNLGRVPSPKENCISVLLDIDLFKVAAVPQSDEEVWAYFEVLRAAKNYIFESCITDKTREIFQ